jgi:hypothetical protein
MTLPDGVQLADLRCHRTAPPLTGLQRRQLQEELLQRVAACEWCTIGVMAPDSRAALAALRSFEQALGWASLAGPEQDEGIEGPVFLKGHQRSGQVVLREEAGLGQGVLLTGHSAANPDLEDTWGPLPLDFFDVDPAQGPELGTIGL